MKSIIRFIWLLIGICYFPIYFFGYLLYIVSRLSLAVAYFLLLEKNSAKDIILNIFSKHGKY